jgi:hypothetical protein
MQDAIENEVAEKESPAMRKVAAPVKKPKKLATAIGKAKASLADKAKKYGVYENFGAEEISFIEDKFIAMGNLSNEQLRLRTAMTEFKEWCAKYKAEPTHSS